MRARGRELSSAGIIGVQDRKVFFALVLKNARLGFAVQLHAVMAVQMIPREIEKHTDVRATFLNDLELETAQLYYGHRVVGHSLDVGNQRRADVAGHNSGK